MIQCLTLVKGLPLALIVLFAVGTTNAVESSFPLSDLYSVINNFVEPLLNTVNVQVSSPDLKSLESQNEQTNIHKSNLQHSGILKNIKLHDKIRSRYNKYTSNEGSLTEESKETIILEIPSPLENDHNKNSIDSIPTSEDRFAKYKKLKHKIKELLLKEQISDKTKGLISDSFDKLINEMNYNCIQSVYKGLSSKTNRRLSKHETAAIKSMLKLYKNKFNKLIDSYRESDGESEIFGSEENTKFLTMLRELFFEMHNSFQNYTQRHGLNCNVFDVHKKISSKHNKLKNNSTVVKEILRNPNQSNTVCQIQFICPYELKMFLVDLSKVIFGTVNLIFGNYKNMYLADVSIDSSGEQKLFVRVLADANSRVDNKFNETYNKEINKLEVVSSTDIKAKVGKVKDFIDATFNHAKMLINDALRHELSRLPKKIQGAVKTDIMTNTENELNNVKEKIEATMCESFKSCYIRDRKNKS